MIKVGEYVRTNYGIIGKIKRIELDNIDKSLKWYIFDRKRPDINKTDEVYINKPYIVKHSKNIIDLIEVGDYVNGKYVREINQYKDGKFIIALIGIIGKNEIKEILTKEQYSQNCYKVEED